MTKQEIIEALENEKLSGRGEFSRIRNSSLYKAIELVNQLDSGFVYEEIAREVDRQISELSAIEGPIIEVRCMATGSMAVMFEKTAYWVKIEKQNEVSVDNTKKPPRLPLNPNSAC